MTEKTYNPRNKRDEQRANSVTVLLLESEKQKVASEAQRLGMSYSTFLRWLVREYFNNSHE